jgi:DNA-binding response OmpR family regulator
MLTADQMSDVQISPDDPYEADVARPTILVVDDDPDLRELVGMRLWHSGFSVTIARNGDDAVAALAEQLPDLIVLDVPMPGTDGLALCRQLREDPATADLPVIMLTARSHPAFVLEGFAAGATSYLTKPFSPRELVAEVESLLAGGTGDTYAREG